MDEQRRWNKSKARPAMIFLLMFSCMFQVHQISCSTCFNKEGLALLKFKERVTNDPFGALLSWNHNNHCSWFGIKCAQERVVALNLRDLCLEGTLAPEIAQLTRIKLINLRNNSFSGVIPQEFRDLKDLQILDLGYNNFTTPVFSLLRNNLSLLVDSNGYTCSSPYKVDNLIKFSKSQFDENLPSKVVSEASSSKWKSGNMAQRKLMQVSGSLNPNRAQRAKHPPRRVKKTPSPAPAPAPSLSPSPSPSPFESSADTPSESSNKDFPPPPEMPQPDPVPAPPAFKGLRAPPPSHISMNNPPPLPIINSNNPAPSPTNEAFPKQSITDSKKSNRHITFILACVIGALLFIFGMIFAFVYCRSRKIFFIKSSATTQSKQLWKVFIPGVQKFERSELVAACEDFSNIIGSLSDGNTIYKGTLSTGVEIAVTSSSVKLAENWSLHSEAQFWEKMDILSKVNHKNFVNLIGYCEEEEPFTKMMVFEYAPNGTLYEHLHVKESERLDWRTRLRIAMGLAYCLEYLHELPQPIALKNLQSSSVYLTEDYAAKIADFSFRNEVTASKIGSTSMELVGPKADPETTVYDFGLILFELITGKIPNTMGNDTLADLASVYMKKEEPLDNVMDPTLSSFREDEVKRLLQVVTDCIQPDMKLRPKMRDVVNKLHEITSLGPEGAIPRGSSLWWAELEILSTASS